MGGKKAVEMLPQKRSIRTYNHQPPLPCVIVHQTRTGYLIYL